MAVAPPDGPGQAAPNVALGLAPCNAARARTAAAGFPF